MVIKGENVLTTDVVISISYHNSTEKEEGSCTGSVKILKGPDSGSSTVTDSCGSGKLIKNNNLHC
jgi:hypothetical protein